MAQGYCVATFLFLLQKPMFSQPRASNDDSPGQHAHGKGVFDTGIRKALLAVSIAGIYVLYVNLMGVCTADAGGQLVGECWECLGSIRPWIGYMSARARLQSARTLVSFFALWFGLYSVLLDARSMFQACVRKFVPGLPPSKKKWARAQNASTPPPLSSPPPLLLVTWHQYKNPQDGS